MDGLTGPWKGGPVGGSGGPRGQRTPHLIAAMVHQGTGLGLGGTRSLSHAPPVFHPPFSRVFCCCPGQASHGWPRKSILCRSAWLLSVVCPRHRGETESQARSSAPHTASTRMMPAWPTICAHLLPATCLFQRRTDLVNKSLCRLFLLSLRCPPSPFFHRLTTPLRSTDTQ